MFRGRKHIFMMAGVLLLSITLVGCSALLEAREAASTESQETDEPSGADREFFVYGEIISIDGMNLEIEQHMDSGSVDVGGRVTLAADVLVYANRGEGEVAASRSDLKVGHAVGMNVGSDGLVHTVIYDDFESTDPLGPADPTRGEIFVYFEIVGLNLEERLIHIEQHMDSGSVVVDSQLRLAGDVRVYISGHDTEVQGCLEDLRVGQSGGLILHGEGNLKGLVRKIIVDGDDQVEPADPRQGEIFIYGEIISIDGMNLEIEQHMDSGSVDVGGKVTMANTVVIRRSIDGTAVVPMEPCELKPGDVVGMIQDADGLIRAIIVE